MGHNSFVKPTQSTPDQQITTHCQQEIASINLRIFSLARSLMLHMRKWFAFKCNYSFGLRLSFSLTHSLTLNSQIQLAFTASEESCICWDSVHAIDASVHSYIYISHSIALMVFVHEFNESNLQAPKWYFSSKKISICAREQRPTGDLCLIDELSCKAHFHYVDWEKKSLNDGEKEVGKMSSKSPKDAFLLIKASAFTKMDFKCT